MTEELLPENGLFVTVVTQLGSANARVLEGRGRELLLSCHQEIPGLDQRTSTVVGQVQWTSQRGVHILDVQLRPGVDQAGRRQPGLAACAVVRRRDVQRRRYTRARGVGRIMLVDSEGRRTDLVPSLDLSEGGAKVRGGGWLRRGDHVVARLVLDDQMLALAAVVRRVEASAIGGYGAVAVEFVPPVAGAHHIRRAVLAAQVQARVGSGRRS